MCSSFYDKIEVQVHRLIWKKSYMHAWLKTIDRGRSLERVGESVREHTECWMTSFRPIRQSVWK